MRLENINLDCVDSAAAGTFWAEVLGAEIITREPTLWEARLRVGEFWMDLCFETVPEPGPDPREHRLHLDLASVSDVRFYPDGPTSVHLVNDTSHLD